MKLLFTMIAGGLLLASSATAGHRRCVDPSDVNYGYDRGYSAYVYEAGPPRLIVYDGYGFFPVIQPRVIHGGRHYGFHASEAGHYGAHSGAHYAPDEGLHSGYHYGYHQGAHYGEHSGIHDDLDDRFAGWGTARFRP